jgi:class 3 adenylate cyclase/tetratricopeptide (TPR) repeat protein
VSIVFCDVVDSTVLGSSVDTEVLRGVLAGYWGRARAVVERHGGTVEKFIGDAVVGVFGVPVVHEDDALRAVRAAADLLVEVRDLNKDFEQRLGIVLAVRVGVNTGEVLSGGEALMSGDAANVAARLEAAAAAGEVLVGESTYRLVRDVVEVVDVGPLVVKGKADPLVAFRLVGVRPTGVGRRRRFSGPLVGRGRQLRLAEAMYATAVEESACVLLTVLGEPGVGKSRLVQELLAGIGADALVLQGRCLAYGEGIGYLPTIEMLTGLAETDAMPLAEHLSGVAHSGEVLAGLETMRGEAETATGGEVAWAFRRLVETLAARRPVVLVVDDVQWAEPALLDLLDHLTDMSRGAPILLVCMARPEFQQTRPGWGSARQHSLTVALRPLTDTECLQLAAQLLGPEADTALLDRVVTASEGVPLFVEELTAMLVDDGQLVAAADGGWRVAADLESVTVPPTVQALLAARLDGLPFDLRQVMDAASVIGQTFYPDAVAELVGDDGEVIERVEALVRADLVQPTTTDLAGHDAYTFSHLLLRDAAYQGLTKARRAALHQALARWLQEQPTPTVSPEVVAFHLEAAANYIAELGAPDPGLAEEAARLLLAAADRALAMADATAAVGLAGRAERLVPSRSRFRAEILLTLSDAASEGGDYPNATHWARQAGQIGADLDDEPVQWRARLQEHFVKTWTDPSQKYDDIFPLTERAIKGLTAAGDDRALIAAYLLRADAHKMMGRVRAMASDARQGLRHAQLADSVGRYGIELIGGVMAPYDSGDGTPTEMEHVLDEISAEFGNEPGMDQALAPTHVMLPAFQGHVAEAIPRAWEHHRLWLDKGSVPHAVGALFYGVAWCQRWSGDLAGASETMATAAELLEGVGETSFRSTTTARMAVLLAQLGRDDDAQMALTQSQAITADDDLINQIYHAATNGLLLARRGDSEGSERQFVEGLRLVAPTEWLLDEGEVWLTRSLAREALGDTAGAVTAATKALACCERKEHVPPIQLARARLAELGG